MQIYNFKQFAVSCLLGLGLVSSALANEPWPQRPVQIIIPFDAGTLIDNVARQLSKSLTAKWNQPVTIINQPGGGAIIGTNSVAVSAPDGYTLGMVTAPFTGALATSRTLPYTRDKLVGVVNVGRQDFMIVAGKNAPFDNVQQMVEYARANPGKLDYATPGVGSYGNITMQHLSKVKDLRLTHVPYKNLNQAVPDIAGGRVHILITGVFPAIKNLIASGELKIVGSLGRNVVFDGKPVSSTANVAPDVHAKGYYGIIAPAGLPASITVKIHKDVTEILDTPEFQKNIIALGAVVEPTGRPGDFDRWIDTEVAKLKKIIAEANIVLE